MYEVILPICQTSLLGCGNNTGLELQAQVLMTWFFPCQPLQSRRWVMYGMWLIITAPLTTRWLLSGRINVKPTSRSWSSTRKQRRNGNSEPSQVAGRHPSYVDASVAIFLPLGHGWFPGKAWPLDISDTGVGEMITARTEIIFTKSSRFVVLPKMHVMERRNVKYPRLPEVWVGQTLSGPEACQ